MKIPCIVRLVRRHNCSQLPSFHDFVVRERFLVWPDFLPSHTTISLKPLQPTPTKLHFVLVGFPAFNLCLFKTLRTMLSESVELLLENFFESDNVFILFCFLFGWFVHIVRHFLHIFQHVFHVTKPSVPFCISVY